MSAARITRAHLSVSSKRDLVLLPDRRYAGAAAIVRHRRQAPDGRLRALPGLRILRRVAVPGPRIEIAERLVLHLVELDIELDRVLVRIAMIGCDVVAGPVPHRPPQ